MATFFNQFFGVAVEDLEAHGAFNITLINDLPLFIDPFLLFNSEKEEYQRLHREILDYIMFLRDAVINRRSNKDLVRAWFYFPEVKQNWLGFSMIGNGGTGLGKTFAEALRTNLEGLFADFGKETITQGSHIEKVCLVQDGVGRDNISDFTTNLVKEFLCQYTQDFAIKYIDKSLRKKVWVQKARFNYETENWERRQYDLPFIDGDYVILTPRDMLTRDENWINRGEMIRDFETIPAAISDAELRGQVFSYFERVLVKPRGRGPNQKERQDAAVRTVRQFPSLIDHYIRLKEDNGDNARDVSSERVAETEAVFDKNVRLLQAILQTTSFYEVSGNTYEESHRRLAYLKDVIENKGGHRIFYHDGVAIQREEDLQRLCRFVWFGSPSDVGTEANDGRGPVDYKISRGAKDKTLIEMKLAKNTGLERNLKNQLPIYQAASDAGRGIKVIVYFSASELARVEGILDRLGILGSGLNHSQ